MTPHALPAGTTLIVAGGRVILPDTDWHRPAIADIALAAPTRAARARPARAAPAPHPRRAPPRLRAALRGAGRDARRARPSGAPGLRQRPLPLPRRAGERHARGGPAGGLAPVCPAAPISAALARGGEGAHAARRARMPAFGHDDRAGHAHALSLRGSPSRNRHGGV